MILSIIIPVYNVEKYVEKCLLSCLKQDIPAEDYEIIVVNDGTPDSSMAIVERIAAGHSNIRIINQDNQGLSMARNNGTALAQGEYIWYVDSDDWIEENCLGRITSQLKDELDILQLQYRKVYENGKSKDNPKCIIDGIQDGKTVLSQGGLPVPAPFSMYRSGFLKANNLEFMAGVYHEDVEFKPRATYFAEKIASDKEICYNYLQHRSGSILSSYKRKNALSSIKVLNSLLAFIEDNKLSERLRIALYKKVGRHLGVIFSGYFKLRGEDKAVIRLILGKNKHLFAILRKSNKLTYQIEGLCFEKSIRFGLFVYALMHPTKIIKYRL